MLSVDQVLCGKNSTRITLNKLYRSALQKKSLIPDDKEKLICNLNNYEITFDDKYTLTNGIQGEIYNFSILDKDLHLAKIDFKPNFSDTVIKDILIDYNIFENNKYLYEKHQKAYLLVDGSYAIKLLNNMETRSKKNYKNGSKQLKRKNFTGIKVKR